MRFLHTADWQLGKPYGGIQDPQKRALAQQERLLVIRRLGAAAQQHQAEFLVVAGDLFDSPTASKATVSAACSEIGQLQIPVLVIPGNHDHAGPGSVWEQPFFLREHAALAPNLRILLKPEPVELDHAWIFPCPLLRRAESIDTTAWLRSPEVAAACDPAKPRIILAHGSTQNFSGAPDDDDSATATNQINLDALPIDAFDYIALGDWHGARQVAPKAWYSGTPEPDRFPRGESYAPGHALLVESSRGQTPQIVPIPTGRLGWFELTFDFVDDASLPLLIEHLGALIGARANQDLLHLSLSGSIGVQTASQLEQLLESLEARLLRLKRSDRLVILPAPQELEALTQRPSDPLTARVASRLVALAQNPDPPTAAAARIALRELYAAALDPR